MTPTKGDIAEGAVPPEIGLTEFDEAELDALAKEIRQEIWLEKQGVQEPIIVLAEPEIDHF